MTVDKRATFFVLLYRLLLRAYPLGFRHAFADEMLETVGNREAEVRTRAGRVRLLRFWLAELSAVVRTALKFRMRRADGAAVRRKDPIQRKAPAGDALLQDVRFAVRSLVKRPALSLISILTLALGIGANTAIFSVVNGVLLRPFPYVDADRLVRIWDNQPSEDRPFGRVTVAEFEAHAEQNTAFEGLAAFVFRPLNHVGDGEPQRAIGRAVSPNWFDLVGARAEHGRTFVPGDLTSLGVPVVVLSDGYWQRQFGGDPSVIGRVIQLNDVGHLVIGIMPAGHVDLSGRADMWVVSDFHDLADNEIRYRNFHFLMVFGKLKPGVSPEQGRADLLTIASRLERDFPQSNAGHLVTLLPLREATVGDVRPALVIFAASVAFVLLIACANVASVMLVRTISRQREIAVRMALGATRGRLVRQMLTESVIVAAIGGAVGVLVAWVGMDTLLAVAPQDIPRLEQVNIDGRVLLFAAGVSLVTGVLFGLAPALTGSGGDVSETLREGSRGATVGRGRQRLRSALVVGQLTLAVVLLIGAGLLLRSFQRLQQVDLGFDAEGVLTFQIQLPAAKYETRVARADFWGRLLTRLAASPGVERAGTTSGLPLWGGATSRLTIEGSTEPIDSEVGYITASSDYFATMGIPVLRGRSFEERDGQDGPLVVVLNETLARQFWPDEDPLGARVKFGTGPDEPWWEVVGVVGDVRQVDLHARARPAVFLPSGRDPWQLLTVVLRTGSDPLRAVGTVRDAVRMVDAELPIANVYAMEQIVGRHLAQPRFSALLLSVFAAVALVLAAVGVYGVIAYSVSQRTHEIGIRMALGAGRGSVVRLVVRRGLLLVGLGVAAGGALALGLTGLMQNLLFGVDARDPITFVSVPVLLALVALLASYLPARRGTKVDPVVALRCE